MARIVVAELTGIAAARQPTSRAHGWEDGAVEPFNPASRTPFNTLVISSISAGPESAPSLPQQMLVFPFAYRHLLCPQTDQAEPQKSAGQFDRSH